MYGIKRWSCALAGVIALAGIFLGVYFGCDYRASWAVGGGQTTNQVAWEQKSTIPQEITSCGTKMNELPHEEFCSGAPGWARFPEGKPVAQKKEKEQRGISADDSNGPALTLVRLPGQVVIGPPEEESPDAPPLALLGLSSTGPSAGSMPLLGLADESEWPEFSMPLVQDEMTAPMPYATERTRRSLGIETAQDPETLPLPQCLEEESNRYSPSQIGDRGFTESQARSLVPALPRTGPNDLKTRHFNVDTLEFRPTDLGFPRDLRGPF
jgi:hypothetical protein